MYCKQVLIFFNLPGGFISSLISAKLKKKKNILENLSEMSWQVTLLPKLQCDLNGVFSDLWLSSTALRCFWLHLWAPVEQLLNRHLREKDHETFAF